jgi:phage tail sheath protein FI
MPPTLTYPGVYVQELPSGVRTIAGVATSITVLVGRAWRGPVEAPTPIFSFADFQRQFGGLWRDSTLSYAVQQFFANGGGQAVILRLAHEATAATLALDASTKLQAASAGTWGRNLTAVIDHDTGDPTDTNRFNLTLTDDPTTKKDALARGGSGMSERFLNVSVDPLSPRYLASVLMQQSTLATATAVGPTRPAATPVSPSVPIKANADGDDGGELDDNDYVPPTGPARGLQALDDVALFNLLCLPPLTAGEGGSEIGIATWGAAADLCAKRRAFLLVDAPADWKASPPPTSALADFTQLAARDHAAIYFPRLLIPDPLQSNKLETYAPCGAVAGVIGRTDAARGVWKAPAGIDANLQGVIGLDINGSPGTLTDDLVGGLNPLGINCLRALPVYGHVVWGSRTLEGADAFASQWKYTPVRRLALYIEESLYRGTQWVVFEPNDEPLWAQIRLNVGSFMQTLFRQGAFQGSTPKDAYFVQCNSQTTTQTDIDNGVVNILVGFAPLKPAEFVVLQIQQISAQP